MRKSAKSALSDDDFDLIVLLASKICSEYIQSKDDITQAQIDALRRKVAQILTKASIAHPDMIPIPLDGKPWFKRGGIPRLIK